MHQHPHTYSTSHACAFLFFLEHRVWLSCKHPRVRVKKQQSGKERRDEWCVSIPHPLILWAGSQVHYECSHQLAWHTMLRLVIKKNNTLWGFTCKNLDLIIRHTIVGGLRNNFLYYSLKSKYSSMFGFQPHWNEAAAASGIKSATLSLAVQHPSHWPTVVVATYFSSRAHSVAWHFVWCSEHDAQAR